MPVIGLSGTVDLMGNPNRSLTDDLENVALMELMTSHSFTCQMIVAVGKSGLCCCVPCNSSDLCGRYLFHLYLLIDLSRMFIPLKCLDYFPQPWMTYQLIHEL